MPDLLTDLPVLGLFLKFITASTVLLGTVWLLDRIGAFKTPDLAELAWKLAIAGSFIALLPVGNWLSNPIRIEHANTAALVAQFNESRPLAGVVARPIIDQATDDQIQVTAMPDGFVTREGIDRPLLKQAPENDALVQSPGAAEPGQTLLPATPAPITISPVTISQATIGIYSEAGSEDKTENSPWQWVADLRPRDLATLFWGFAALVAVAGLLAGYRAAILSLGSRARVDGEHPANQTLRALCAQVNIKHVPYLSRSSDIGSPVCLPRREICLPDWVFESLPATEMKSLLAHELGHMVRRDPLMLMALQLLSRLFFFQPLFRVARRRLTDLAELAADEWAARQVADPRAVAAALFTCATKIYDSNTIQWGLAMAGNKSMLKRRVERLIGAKGAPFENTNKAAKGLVVAGVLGLAIGLPSIEFADALALPEGDAAFELAMASHDDHEREAKRAEHEARRAEQAAARSARAAEARAHTGSRSSSFSEDGNSGTISLSDNDYRLKARWDGAFTLSDDYTDIKSVEKGGWIEIKTNDGDHKHKIRITNDSGKLDHTYWRDGDKKTGLDADGKKWLAETILNLVRRTGWKADERVAGMLKKGGNKAVLAEIGNLQSDYVRRTYAVSLVKQSELKDADQQKLIDIVATMDSDYEKRQVLTALMTEEKVSDKMLPKVLAVAKSVDSDYEKRTMLTPYLQKFPLDDRTMQVLIDIAAAMDSDYEKRQLLTIALNGAKLSIDNVEKLVGIAANNIESDYEMRQLLGLVASQLATSPAATELVIKSLVKMDSDYEKRQTLDMAIAMGAMSKKSWSEAISASHSIDSDYEKSQALSHIHAMMPNDAELKQELETAVKAIDSDYHRRQLLDQMYGRGISAGGPAPRPAAITEPPKTPDVAAPMDAPEASDDNI